jgi:hypothetical protein
VSFAEWAFCRAGGAIGECMSSDLIGPALGQILGCMVAATIELYPPRLRPRMHAATRSIAGGNQSVKIVKPNTTDPIPMRTSSPKMGTIMVRFVVLLIVAVALLALVWSR